MKLAILIVLMVSILGLKLQTHLQEENQQFHTIIVGAGMAGMAAASQLAKKGHSVLVLEANDYIGGRLKTKPIKLSDNSTFQFQEGANWIHGSNPDHPITKLSQQISGFKYIATDDEQILNYLVDGTQVDQQVDAQNEPYEELQDKMVEMQNVSIYDAFKKLDPSKLNNKYFMSLVSHDIQFQTASPINEISAQYGIGDSAYDGQEALVVSGYQSFAEHLGKSSKIKFLLKHKVTSVKYDGKNKVSCQNGRNFSSQYVVIAVPLGVLKAKTIQFEPQLPSQKLDAIQKLHFGGVCKVLVILKKKLQVQKQHYIAVIPESVQERGKAAYFVNIQGLAGVPALMTFGLGPNADEIEKMPEDQLKELIASRISAFSEQKFSADEIEIARSTWSTNPNFRGAYSAAGVQALPRHWEDMAEPVLANKWFFSGEHTISNHRATVHGAYESGVKAANDIHDQSNEQEDDLDE